MDRWLLGRLVGLLVAAAFVTGCGGQAGNEVPQTATASARAHRSSGSSGDLIYAPGGCGGNTCVLTYPKGKVVGVISWVGSHIFNADACSDAEGNVFISNNTLMAEYVHGGTSPIATLQLPGDSAWSCSVDPASGNLAVVFSSHYGDVAVFTKAQGSPTVYVSHLNSSYLGYDNAGNLFVGGYDNGIVALAEMPAGSSTFTKISVDKSVGLPGRLQWDGQYLTWQSTEENHPQISRLSISGSSATIVSTTVLAGIGRRATPTWIYKNKVVAAYADHGANARYVGIWPYPAGGQPWKNIRKFKGYPEKDRYFDAVTISRAPSK